MRALQHRPNPAKHPGWASLVPSLLCERALTHVCWTGKTLLVTCSEDLAVHPRAAMITSVLPAHNPAVLGIRSLLMAFGVMDSDGVRMDLELESLWSDTLGWQASVLPTRLIARVH